MGMLTPLPSALAYRLFGADTPLAEFVLSIWAVAVVSIGFWLAWRLACALEVPRLARIAAVAFVALVPLQFGLETREGRSWEVNLAVVLLLWVLLRLVLADKKDTGPRDLAMTGAIGGFLFIVSPPAGLAAVAADGALSVSALAAEAMVDRARRVRASSPDCWADSGPSEIWSSWASRSCCATISAWNSTSPIIPGRCIRPIRMPPIWRGCATSIRCNMAPL